MYLTVEALVLAVRGARVLVGGDDGHHLVAAELLPLGLEVWVPVTKVPPDALETLGPLGTVATHEASDRLERGLGHFLGVE